VIVNDTFSRRKVESEIIERLHRIESVLEQLAKREKAKEFYSTDEVAAILQKSRFTIREWCRLGRINATKRLSGRGLSRDWTISRVELLRLDREGLLPRGKNSTANRAV
jgi:hypothetical protein